jgi:hypothetical protein
MALVAPVAAQELEILERFFDVLLADLSFSRYDEAKAELIQMELRQQALELLLRLRALEAVAQYARVDSNLRDLKLDEGRTLYEQEYTADLGFSMSRQTEARLRERQIAYCQGLTWAELNALQGKAVWSAAEGGK